MAELPYHFHDGAGNIASGEQVTANDQFLLDLIEAILPVGTIVATGRSSAPAGWLMCDGAAVSRAEFPDLWDAIGTTYGPGDGSTTFNLPDLRGRVPVGVDGAAGRLSTNDALGQAGGAERHPLTVDEMPAHNHGGATGGPSDVSHTHGMAAVPVQAGGGQEANVTPGGSVSRETGGVFAGGLSAHTHAIAWQGGGQPHSSMQPYQIVNFMIRT